MIFLDRDGTLNRDKGYTYKIEDYELLPGVKTGIKKLLDNGYHIVILTSQSGIGRGMYTEADYQKFTKHLLKDLQTDSMEILGIYYCPHHPEEGIHEYKKECNCRKPQPGLLLQAENEHGPFDYEHSWAIGDAVRDLEMAKNTHQGITTILVPKNYGTADSKPLEESDMPDFKAQNFSEAVAIILNHS